MKFPIFHKAAANDIFNLKYFLFSLLCLAVAIYEQSRIFRRIDYDILVFVFVCLIQLAVISRNKFLNWLAKLSCVYLFSIMLYLFILFFNTKIYSYNPINSFDTLAELLVAAPFLGMAWLFFVIQSAWPLLTKLGNNGK